MDLRLAPVPTGVLTANGRPRKGVAAVVVVALLVGGCGSVTVSPTPSASSASLPTAASSPRDAPSAPPTAARNVASWTATGSLRTARSRGALSASEVATLLPDGRVLVAGGIDASGKPLASAELYDPATGTWSLTGSMTTPRAAHTSTLLMNGKVLVAGGGGLGIPGSVLASAELYDPATGTWGSIGSMIEARGQHSATLLADGKVLVAGGAGVSSRADSYEELSSAELYDPTTGAWTLTGSMTTARWRHAAVKLADGIVLVEGGGHLVGLASAELYDPTTATWRATDSLIAGRGGQTATLLPNGEVLVAGGQGGLHMTPLASVELYDPITGKWSATGSMAKGRFGHTATLLANGSVLVVAGYGREASGPFAEVYRPGADIWSATANLTPARIAHVAVLLADGRVLIAGGIDDEAPGHVLASAEIYDPGDSR